MRRLSFIALSLGLASSGVVLADDAAPTSDFKFTGYIDGAYNYLKRSDHFTSLTNSRVYDTNPKGVSLQQASITLAFQPKNGFGALVNPIIGKDTLTFAANGINANIFTTTNHHWIGFDVPQGFLQYACGPFTLMAGRFLTIAGAEVLDPTQDTNFSRSILYGYAEPTTVTGLRGVYVMNDSLNFTVGIEDGWDNVTDWGRGKTLELGASYTLNPMFSFSLQGYGGKERANALATTGRKGNRYLIDFVGTMNATDKLTFILNYDYAWQTDATLPAGNIAEAHWNGVAGYANYKIFDQWRASLRGEYFKDEKGFRTGVAQDWKEGTLTLAYSPLKDLEVSAEARYDFSNVASFANQGNLTSDKKQHSYALNAYYKFD